MITWDEKKRQRVIKRHGVDFGKIEDVFYDQFAMISEDYEHGDEEERWILIGRSSTYGLISVVYTIRDENFHIITSRRAENWMVRLYEKQGRRF